MLIHQKIDVISASLSLWQMEGKRINLRVQGTSMLPLIKEGDSVCIRVLPPEGIKLGEVIAFSQNQNIIVHRLIAKKKINGHWLFCQKGDNLLGWTWINQEQILGRVEAIRRQGIDLLRKRQKIDNQLIAFGQRCLIVTCESIDPLIKKYSVGIVHRLRLAMAINWLLQKMISLTTR